MWSTILAAFCVVVLASLAALAYIFRLGERVCAQSLRIQFTRPEDVRELAPGVRGCTATDVRCGILVGNHQILDLSGRNTEC